MWKKDIMQLPRRLRQEDCKLKLSISNLVITCFKIKFLKMTSDIA
jgi:hypothetical protein